MYNDHKKQRFSDHGRYKPNFKRQSDRGGDWKPTFPAVCASCGADCQVPFKPNGRKPVMCSLCFKKDGPSESRSYERPYGGSSERSHGGASSDLSGQLRAINEKLDAILEALSE